MKTETKNIWSSTSARILGAFLLLAPCSALTACGDEETTPTGGETTAVCGNGTIESGEVCDGAAMPADAPDGATCKADCTGWETETPTSVCGNGVIEDGEECDGEVLPNGVEEGTTCLDTCQLKAPNCGNGVIDAGEECDYSESGEHLMPSGIAQGAECLANCSLKVCGNERIDEGEVCDGTALPEGTTEGALCLDTCIAIDHCPDSEKMEPTEVCGCSELADTLDDDGDETPNCVDACPFDRHISTETNETGCECGETNVDGECYLNIDTAEAFIQNAGQKAAILKDNINLGTELTIENGKAKWTPLNTATAVLLGGGYTVTASDPNGTEGNRLTLICEASACGLFTAIGANGKTVTISDLTVDLDIETWPGSAKSANAGLLAGDLNGKSTLSGVHAKGKLTIANASSTSYVGGLVGSIGGTETILDSSAQVTLDVTGAENVGGLVGYLGGKLYNAWAEGNVSLKSDDTFSLGGLVGLLDGTVTNAYAIGAVTASLNTESSSNKDGFVGGLVGTLAQAASITNAYALGTVTGRPNTTGAVGASNDTVGGTIGNMQGKAKHLYWWQGSVSDCIGSEPTSTVCGEQFEKMTLNGNETIGWEDDDSAQTLSKELEANLSTEAIPCTWEDRDGDNKNDTCVGADGGHAYRLWIRGETSADIVDSTGNSHTLFPVRLFGLP